MQARVNLKVSILLRREIIVSLLANDPKMRWRAEGKTFDPLTPWLGINTASPTCFISTKAACKECWLEKFKAAHADGQLQSEHRGLRNGPSSNSPGQEKALETENRIFHLAPRPSLLDPRSRGGSQTCPFEFAGCKDPNPRWAAQTSPSSTLQCLGRLVLLGRAVQGYNQLP